MKNLLFLVHRIPYPPNKGDKIRSYNFLKGLAENYNVHLAAFIDDPADTQYIGKLEKYTASTLFIKLNPFYAKIKSLSGLFTQKALSLPYYQSSELQQWVDKTIVDKKIDKIFVFSSVMAQFVHQYKELDVIIDFVDVDSDKWLQYSRKANWPMNWVYQREAKLLLKFDHQVAEYSKTNIFVSQEEAALFSRLVDIEPKKIDFVCNGVDTDYFKGNQHFQTPYIDGEKDIIVFTGAMDYWANVDAVSWFVTEVFPKIKQQCKHAKFFIVGSRPSSQVFSLEKTEGVFVTGGVRDIRPYLYYAQLVVAPLQIARGIQNKVLEAMAMSKRIVVTPQAIEGIQVADQDISIAEGAEVFAKQVLSYLADVSDNTDAEKNRDFVTDKYSWAVSHQRLTEIIESK